VADVHIGLSASSYPVAEAVLEEESSWDYQ